MKRVRKRRGRMKTKTVVMDPFDICHVAQRANKIDTRMLIR